MKTVLFVAGIACLIVAVGVALLVGAWDVTGALVAAAVYLKLSENDFL